MIDPHVHLRDFEESSKETVAHGLSVAWRAGLDAVFEMPNTNPPLLSREIIKERLALADNSKVPVFHGVYGGLTGNPGQVKEIVNTWKELFPRVVGLKLYAGRSTGDLSVISPDEQENIFFILAEQGFDGVLAVHCEKESLFREDLYTQDDPFSHTLCRPPESEVQSIADIAACARESRFRGTLHICHISTPKSVELVEETRQAGKIKITCGITPHHALLYDELMKNHNGFQLKINPPLRPKEMQTRMLHLLFEGKIDWIETDHAPHLLHDKRKASGIPGLPFYPRFISILQNMGMDNKQIEELTHSSICRGFGIDIKTTQRQPDLTLAGEYEFDPFLHYNRNL